MKTRHPMGLRHPVQCTYFFYRKRGHFPQKRPMISGSFAGNDLQRKDKESYGSSPPCTSRWLWPGHVCDMTHSYVWHDMTLSHEWHGMTPSYVHHGSFIRVTWQDTFICATRLIYTCVMSIHTCGMTWHIRMGNMTHSIVCCEQRRETKPI